MLGVRRVSRFRMEVVVRRWIDVPRPFFVRRAARTFQFSRIRERVQRATATGS